MPARTRRRRNGRRAWQGADIFAALDLGTNNCRLLVARPTRDGFRVIDAFSRIVRLGEGLGASGELSEAAIDRTIAALRICAGKMRRRGVTHARNVATEACRRAANCERFIGRVADETGIALEIISTGEEARLALEGCVPLLDPAVPRAVLFDIGGGSTEMLWVAVDGAGGPEIIESVSLPCGVVGMSERHGGRHVDEAGYRAMVEEVGDRLAPFEARNGIAARAGRGEVQMLGTSGTVTTLAGIHMDLPRYSRAAVDGCWMGMADAMAVAERLVCMDASGRAAHPCIGPERADMVVAGTAIFAAIGRICPVSRLRVADRGLREGILVGLMERARHERSGPCRD